MRRWFFCLFAALPFLSAAAEDGEALAHGKACFACHKVDAQVIGPAFQDIAAKYQGDPEAAAKIGAQIKNGGVGLWGQIPMPPNPHLSDDEIQVLTEWILSL